MQRLVLLFAALLLFSCRTQQHKAGQGMVNMPEPNYSGTAALKKALGDRPLILAGEIRKRGGKRVALLEGRHVVGPAPGRATCGTPTTSGIWILFTGDRAAALQLCGGWYDVGPSATWWVHDPKRKCLAAAVRPRHEKVASIKLGSGPRARKALTINGKKLELELTARGFSRVDGKAGGLRYRHRTDPAFFSRADPVLPAYKDDSFKGMWEEKPGPTSHARKCGSGTTLDISRAGEELLFRFRCDAGDLDDDVWLGWSGKKPRLQARLTRTDLFDSHASGCDSSTYHGRLRHVEYHMAQGSFLLHRERSTSCTQECEDASPPSNREEEGEDEGKDSGVDQGPGHEEEVEESCDWGESYEAHGSSGEVDCETLLTTSSLKWKPDKGSAVTL